jgi:Arc/MetJ-type ribon-helix-helix transcriptional regulator
MRRITLSIPQELHSRLKARAAERHISMAEVIRQSLERRLERPKPHLGGFESGETALSERAGEARLPPRRPVGQIMGSDVALPSEKASRSRSV